MTINGKVLTITEQEEMLSDDYYNDVYVENINDEEDIIDDNTTTNN